MLVTVLPELTSMPSALLPEVLIDPLLTIVLLVPDVSTPSSSSEDVVMVPVVVIVSVSSPLSVKPPLVWLDASFTSKSSATAENAMTPSTRAETNDVKRNCREWCIIPPGID